MKKARIIMAILMLLGAASLAEAQIVVSQTTASTSKVYEKSGREQGFVIRPELGLGADLGYCGGWFLGLHATFAYQFNPYFTLGAGTGLNCLPKSHADIRPEMVSAFPLFANARVYFCDRQWSPFFDVKVGFHVPWSESYYKESGYWEGEYSEYTMSLSGLLLCGTLGMQYKNFDFGCTAGMIRMHEHYYTKYKHLNTNWYDYYDSESRDDNYGGLLILGYVAYNIQFKKK